MEKQSTIKDAGGDSRADASAQIVSGGAAVKVVYACVDCGYDVGIDVDCGPWIRAICPVCQDGFKDYRKEEEA